MSLDSYASTSGVFCFVIFSIGISWSHNFSSAEGSQSLSSVWTLPSLADSRSVRFETSGTKAMVGLPPTPATVGAARSTMSAKAIAKAKLEVKALMDSKALYAGGIPYM